MNELDLRLAPCHGRQRYRYKHSGERRNLPAALQAINKHRQPRIRAQGNAGGWNRENLLGLDTWERQFVPAMPVLKEVPVLQMQMQVLRLVRLRRTRSG
jgi:hypothetical protein